MRIIAKFFKSEYIKSEYTLINKTGVINSGFADI